MINGDSRERTRIFAKTIYRSNLEIIILINRNNSISLAYCPEFRESDVQLN